MKNNKLLLIISISLLTTIMIIGATFAYLQWATSNEQRSNVTFTTGSGFSCSADGGQSINQNEVELIPTSCMDSQYAIKRVITVHVDNSEHKSLFLDLWLEIEQLSQGLSQSHNFSYALTTSSDSCSGDGVIASGNFNGKSAGGRVNLLNNASFILSSNQTYYLYIWLEYEGLDKTSQDQQFSLSLNGECSDMNPGFSNEPELVDGLIPVVLSPSGDTVTVADVSDSWYVYGKKKWANAVLVNENTYTRSYYMNNPGVEIPETDILAYYVWIPRYEYKVWAYSGDDSSGMPMQIPIRFVSVDTKNTATKIGEWQTHPAFTFGDNELSGIWVGKFETSHQNYGGTSASDLGCSATSCNVDNLRIIPNVRSLTNNKVSSAFYATRTMEKSNNAFGLVSSDVDSHMMKNSEWGAVAYLSHSKYGINDKIRINNAYNVFYRRQNRTYLTGCGAATPNENYEAACDIQYGTVSTGIYPQSTTGNVTGIFDMSGGASEYVMGTYNNDNSNGNTYSGFNSTPNSLPNSKYYDNYPNPPFDGNYSTNLDKCTFATCGGHALNETDEWYYDDYDFVSDNSWFTRGAGSNYASVFTFYVETGIARNDISFRSVLVKESNSGGPK